jgi:hypothetical protein
VQVIEWPAQYRGSNSRRITSQSPTRWADAMAVRFALMVVLTIAGLKLIVAG